MDRWLRSGGESTIVLLSLKDVWKYKSVDRVYSHLVAPVGIEEIESRRSIRISLAALLFTTTEAASNQNQNN